ncbi:hypothetical protein [Planctomycetes bacterium K23_9]|uniref:Dynamin family protein n=1 Tax=Stieleria marina TaxID=1930275 RepID=A0A517NU37_9BACT|nr:hypothetical protein K239x_25880 [Planctomycetes bacterium K23_9]
MFGLRRNQDEESIDWPSLQSLLEDDDQRAIVKREFPVEGRESFLSAIRRIDEETAANVLAAGRQYQSAAKLVGFPTLAIAGMLNSGKTSLVATFLSEQGRNRTLRGASNEEGTHRFVLWLPQAWRSDTELWGLLMADLGDAIGMPPEMLSEIPSEAHDQYNNRVADSDSLSIPLVATDPGLDAAGIGLLDCPDIVSDEAFGLGSPQDRRELLGRAATFCSAFIVVSSAESSRDSTLGDLLRISADLMPGIPRLLAVNKIRPRQTPDQVLDTFGPLARGHGIESVFAAYDFDVPASKPFIPTDDETVAALEQDDDPQPVFFSIDSDPDNNPPAAISEERLLRALPKRLDRSESSDKFILAREHSLRTYLWESAFMAIDRDADQSIQATEKARKCLMDACLEFFARREPGGKVIELRLHQSQRIIRQLTESFALTAPWYARWGVRMNGWLQRAMGGASDFIKQLTPTAIAKRTAGEIKDKFRRGEYGGLMTPERLQSAIDRFGGSTSLPHWFDQNGQVNNRLQWDEAAEAAVTRYERDDFTTLDPRRLDDAVRQMWAEVPMRKKLAAGLTPLAAMLAAFGGVLMIPFDFGSTAAIASASIPELFAALGLTTLATMWAGGQNTRNVGQQAARQQLADFHAVLCDTYGVARPKEAQTIALSDLKENLPKSQIQRRDGVGPALSVYRVRDEFRQELQHLLPRSGPVGS